MPASALYLKVKRNPSRPTFDEIFKAQKKSKTLIVEAEVMTDKGKSWRPQGVNSYEIMVVRIEGYTQTEDWAESREKEPDFPKFKYRAICQLVGMNNEKGKHPKEFSYPSNDIENRVVLLLSGPRMYFQYHEYLTL